MSTQVKLKNGSTHLTLLSTCMAPRVRDICWPDFSNEHNARTLIFPTRSLLHTSTPLHLKISHGFLVTNILNVEFEHSFDGTQRSWCRVRIMKLKESAATFQHSLALQVCTKLVSTISSTAKTTESLETMCTSKVTPHQASTHVRSLNIDSTKQISTISDEKLVAMERDSLVIRIHASCQSSGNSLLSLWGSDR